MLACRPIRSRGRNYAGMLPTLGSLPPTAGQNPRSPHRHRHRRHVGGPLSLRTSRVGGVDENKGRGHRAEWQPLWRSTCATALSASEGMGRERENGREETAETYTHSGRRRRGLALRWLGASSCRRPCLGRTARGALSSCRLHLGLESEDGEVVLFFYEEWGER